MSAKPLADTGDVEMGAVSGGAGGVNLPPEPEERGPLKPIAETTPRERAAGIVGGAAVGTSLAAIAVERSGIVIIAGIFSCIMGPYSYWQQTRLTDIAALKETHEAIQVEVDRLHAENERLERSVNDLSSSVERLEDVEQALDMITKTQGQSISTFEGQVAENRKILKEMQNQVKTSVLQNLLDVILKSDNDGSSTIDGQEVEKLVQRISKIGGVNVNEERFRRTIEGKSTKSVLNIVKNLLKDDIPEEEKIFSIKE